MSLFPTGMGVPARTAEQLSTAMTSIPVRNVTHKRVTTAMSAVRAAMASTAANVLPAARAVANAVANRVSMSAKGVWLNSVETVSMKTKGALIAMKNKKQQSNQRKPKQSSKLALRFSPTAWAKLLFLRDYGDTEVGGFGIAAADDLLYLEDIRLVKQVCTWAHVAFNDESVADLFDEQVDAGRQPEQFARIWIHTHPGNCPRPSSTDEKTFGRVFGSAQWAVMFILAQEGQSYARLRFNVGPTGDFALRVDVDYERPFAGCDSDAWAEEYLDCVQPHLPEKRVSQAAKQAPASPFQGETTEEWQRSWFDYITDEERQGTEL